MLLLPFSASTAMPMANFAIEGSAVLTIMVSSDGIKKPNAMLQSCRPAVRTFCHISTTGLLFLREKRSRRRSKKRYTTGVV
ncbi:Uncharacterised protein [Salmonella enterica subsp. arizonae]|nr:Uncharacterised protein [Salmonella enterica subsp. arizonae]